MAPRLSNCWCCGVAMKMPNSASDMVKEFNELCHSNGLLSIIEPVVRPPRRGDKFCREQAIIDAAKELGDSGADLYKVEMPLYGKGTQQELLSASQRLNENINMPWVILSSGVDENCSHARSA